MIWNPWKALDVERNTTQEWFHKAQSRQMVINRLQALLDEKTAALTTALTELAKPSIPTQVQGRARRALAAQKREELEREVGK